MPHFAIRRINDRLGIDLGTDDGCATQSRFYDGRPALVGSFEVSQAEIIGTVELSDATVEQIDREYQEGGECTCCQEPARKLRTLTEAESEAIGWHYDPENPDCLCLNCWREERGELLYNTRKNGPIDLGPFDDDDESEPCSICSTCTTVYEEFEGRVICETCGEE